MCFSRARTRTDGKCHFAETRSKKVKVEWKLEKPGRRHHAG
jgi:hypothetical protein